MNDKPTSPIHRWLSTGSISLEHQDYRKSTYLASEKDIEDKLCIDPSDEINLSTPSAATYAHSNIESYENLIYTSDYQCPEIKNGIVPQGATKTFSEKYAHSLQHLYPFRKKPKRNTLPGNDAGLLSFISTSWMTGFMWKTYRTGEIETNKWKLHGEDECEINVSRLERIWYNEVRTKGKKDSSFFKCILKFGQTRFIVTAILIMIAAVCQFLGPGYCLMLIVSYVEETYESEEKYLGKGFLSVFYLILVLLIRLFTISSCWVMGIHMGCKLEGAIQAMLFKKALCLQGGEKLATQIITLSTNDMERIFEAVCAWPLIFMTPVMFIMSLVYGCYVLGPWPLLGMAVILLSYPVMGVIAALGMKLRHKTVFYTDKRVSLMNEVLNNIKLIKMYGWEDSFVNILKGIRKQEHNSLIKAAMLLSLNSAISPSITPLATIVTFIAHTLSGNGLTASEGFTIYSVFASLQFSVTSLPYTLRCIGESIVCFRRIQSLMLAPSAYSSLPKTENNFDIELERASFGIDSECENVSKERNMSRKDTKANLLKPDKTENLTDILFDLNLKVEKGLLLGVCGEVGSGKSSLLSALCGSMKLQSGHAALKGSIAYVSQVAWIFNGTLRNNILFGEVWHQEWYSKVLESCCLYPDLEMLPTGDMTELGDKGVNLSGGQKQRISLARALYSRRDIYLLDDPLSALDSQVAQLVFENYVRDVLRNKTVILVTHNIQFLERCDEIIVMKNGNIVEQGSHNSLLDLKGEYNHFIKFDTKRENVDELSRVNTSDDLNIGTNEEMGVTGELYDNEDMGKGEVSLSVYHQYLKAAQGTCFSIFVLVLVVLSSATKLFDGLWLQYWIDSGDGLEDERLQNMTRYNTTSMYKELKGYVNENPQLWFFQTVYLLSFVMILTVGIIKGFSLVRLFLLSSTHLHNQMLLRVLHCSTLFFDTNPIGRILNRFSKDMDEIDVRIPFIIDFVSQGICVIILQMILITVFYPYFIGIVIVIIIIYIVADMFLNVGIRAAKRHDNVTKSHLIHQIQSAVQGQTMINVYGKQQFITKQYLNCVNENLLAATYFRFASRWYAYKLESLALVLIMGTSVIVVLIKQSPAVAGLALSTVFQICMFSTVLMRLKAELTARFTAAERVLEYAKTLPQEAPYKLDSAKLPDTWPAEGKIEMRRVNMRYRPNMPLVLKDLTVVIEGGQKIGIIGRTGAGKSSLMSVLLRLVEIESGIILIDDIDISNIGLGDLRKSIAVIPQDPVLFRGSIRYNLDPFDEYDDETIWTVLEKSHLKETISRTDQKLDSQVSPGGSNFSVGERQLICLARALLRKSKVLLLDEATASVDVRTDKLIQNTICETFSNCTVLTIAHRLNTIVTYDRIMVLKEGKVLEFGTPQELMDREDSLFRAMLLAMGIKTI